MIYPIVMYGDPVLRQKAKDIEPGTDLHTLVSDMFETMHAAVASGSLRLKLARASVVCR